MFELRDAIRHLDEETDYIYDLTNMYEATELSEPEKKLLAAMIADAKEPKEIADTLFDIFNTQNAMNMDEGCDSTVTEEGFENWKDFKFIVKCNDGPKELVSVVAENKSKAEEYAKDMYAANHTTYADDRYNEWSVKDVSYLKEGNHFDEALHIYPNLAIDEFETFKRLCDKIGLKTFADVENFMKENGKGKDVITALKDYLINELGIDFHAKDESLKENAENSTWEEVASKAVEDSDGFLTDYVWYTNGDKHVFVFGDSDIYRPEDEDFDWEIDIVEGKEAEAYKEAQDWFNSYNGFAEDVLDEAQDIFDIQGQAVRDSKRKEVLDEFKEIFGDGDNGEVNTDTEESLEIVRGFLEDSGYTVVVSESSDVEHPIHLEWFK